MSAKPVAQSPNPLKAEKPKKIKVVRDSFTIPKPEFEKIDALKKRALALGVSVKKSELLRAGLLILSGMSDTAFKAAVANVPVIKTGRPEAEPKAVAPKPTTQKMTAKKPAVKQPAARKPTSKKPAAKRPVVKAASTANQKAPVKRVLTQKVAPAQNTAQVKAAPTKAV